MEAIRLVYGLPDAVRLVSLEPSVTLLVQRKVNIGHCQSEHKIMQIYTCMRELSVKLHHGQCLQQVRAYLQQIRPGGSTHCRAPTNAGTHDQVCDRRDCCAQTSKVQGFAPLGSQIQSTTASRTWDCRATADIACLG